MKPLLKTAALADRPLRHALVLGASGYIGVPLVQTLVEMKIRTSCLVHRRPPPVAGIRVLTGSIDRFRWRTLEDDPPDVIFHLARIPRRRRFDAPIIRARNRAASLRLLYWLASCPRPPLGVFVGGTLAYGSRGEAVVTEETAASPVSFSRDYHAAEVPWLRARAGDDAPLIIARPPWVLGPGSWFEAYYGQPIRDERIVPLYGGGDNWMSLLDVEDCAGLLVHIARHAPPMTVTNLALGWTLRQRELSERLARLTGLPLRPISLEEVEARHGRAVGEAFSFSARVGTIHSGLLETYRPRHLDLDGRLQSLLMRPSISA